jgi:hypothetical protein
MEMARQRCPQYLRDTGAHRAARVRQVRDAVFSKIGRNAAFGGKAFDPFEWTGFLAG